MKLIILDFDGTIGDTKSLIVKTFQQTIKELCLEPRTDDECAATIGLPLIKAFMSLYDIDEATGELYTDTYRRIFYRNNTRGAIQPFPNTIETLHTLHKRGYTLTIASSRNRHTLDEYIAELNMKEIILIKNGELALKGLNRSTFEDILIKNIRKRIKPLGEFEYRKEQSTVSVIAMDDYI